MKPINRLIQVTAKEFDLTESDILTSKKHIASAARSVLFLLARHNDCATDTELMEITGIRQSHVRVATKHAHEACLIDKRWCRRVNDISFKVFKKEYWTPELAVSKKEKNKAKPERDINKNPFGIIYTESDKLLMKKAIEQAFAFMSDFGKGEQPLIDGFPITRKRAQ